LQKNIKKKFLKTSKIFNFEKMLKTSTFLMKTNWKFFFKPQVMVFF